MQPTLVTHAKVIGQCVNIGHVLYLNLLVQPDGVTKITKVVALTEMEHLAVHPIKG